MKTCTRCKKERPISDFRKAKGYKEGIYSRCKSCEKDELREWRRNNPDKLRGQWVRSNEARLLRGYNWHKNNKDRVRDRYLKRKYGISLSDYNELLRKQKSKCACCGDPPKKQNGRGTHSELVVDHCHKSNKVRALLCDRCNRALGVVDDDKEVLKELIIYLETDR